MDGEFRRMLASPRLAGKPCDGSVGRKVWRSWPCLLLPALAIAIWPSRRRVCRGCWRRAGRVLAQPAGASTLPPPAAVDIPARQRRAARAVVPARRRGAVLRTVIALHGCGGLSSASEPIRARYADWVEQWLKAGHAVLLPDSYGSRELGPQCRLKERRVLARRDRVADVLAARRWLLQQDWVMRGRISLIGWDNGASALAMGGPAATDAVPARSRIFTPRWRSIRTAGCPPGSAGARGCRRCC